MGKPERSFNLADIFATVAELHPDRPAVLFGKRGLSFRQLDARSTRLASALHDQGVRRGDHIGIQLFNSPAYLETFFACCKLGAVPANINYRYVADELRQLFRSLDLKGVVHGAEFAAAVDQVVPQVPTLRWRVQVGGDERAALGTGIHAYERLVEAGADHFDDPQRSDTDRLLLCTGGTTGLPRGVIWPHRNLFMGALGGGGMYFRRGPVQSLEELASLVAQAPEVRYLALAPLMHGAALWASLISLFAAQTVVLDDQHHFDAEQVWQLVQDRGVDILSGVGDAMALPLVQALERHPGRWQLQRVMVYGNGGAPLSAQLVERIKVALPQVIVSNGMGSSEAGFMGGGEKPAGGDGLLVLPPRPDLALFGEGRQRLTEVGAVGTLARTGHTPVGYYGDPQKTADVFIEHDGRTWVLTGDQARLDDQGRYVLLGRGSQCINSGGEKIFPEEVEEAVRRHPGVRDVLVVGLPDERWGQRVVAVVEAEGGASVTQPEIEAVCRAHLAGYKIPRQVFMTPRVVRSPAGKADYRWAREYVLNQA